MKPGLLMADCIYLVIPAKAGIHWRIHLSAITQAQWIPAFAGMTMEKLVLGHKPVLSLSKWPVARRRSAMEN
jgi:hypothetical protein